MLLHNSNNDFVIHTNRISKIYRLYNSPKDRLKESLHPRRKRYHKEFYALKDINLEVKRGEVLGIVGQNGSGKSTLLKILSKVLTPSKGIFFVKGKVTSLLELGSGFNPELTGIENVFFYATILGFTENKIKAKLDEILSFADIGDFIYQPLRTYSSGMRARLAFAVAVNVEPNILILDEVLAVGDEMFRRKCYAKMEDFFRGGKTILLVSHSIPTINQLCNRAIMLDKGELILEGPAKLVTMQYERYLFAKKENMATIRNEIIALNKNNELKIASYEEIERNKLKGKQIKNDEELPVEFKEERTTTESQAKNNIRNKAYFLPGLTPKSTVKYRNEDVDITDVCITTIEGKKVNVLLTGDVYIYKYNVHFNIDAEEVSFGMKFKTENGFEINGCNTRKLNKLVPKVNKGQVFSISWYFTCNLLFGNYFTNAGVASIKNNEFAFLSRIVDAMIFKVIFMEDKPYAHLVNLDQTVKIDFAN